MKDKIITLETASLAQLKGCDIIGYKKKYSSFSRFSDATKFCEEYSYKFSEDSYTITDGGRDEHSNTFDVEILTNILQPLPTQSLLQRWLREIHKIEISLICFDGQYLKHVKKREFKANHYLLNYTGSYEEVLEMALVEGLNLINNG